MDTVTMLGFVILSGIVVNNAILIVHQSLNNVREGLEPQEALLASVRTRRITSYNVCYTKLLRASSR